MWFRKRVQSSVYENNELTIVERAKALAAKHKNVIIHLESAILSGFRLYIIEEWLLEDPAQRFSVLQFTGDELDVVHVAVLRADPPSEAEFLTSLIKPRTSAVSPMMSSLGTAFIISDPPPSNLTLLLVPDGDLDAHMRVIYRQLVLRLLGCGQQALSLLPSTALTAKFFQLYGSVSSMEETPDSAVRRIAAEFVSLLVLFGYIPGQDDSGRASPPALPISRETIAAAASFAADYNTARSASDEPLQVASTLTPAVLHALHATLDNARRSLDAIGFKTRSSLPVDIKVGVKGFQRFLGAPVDGVLSQRIRARLGELTASRTTRGDVYDDQTLYDFVQKNDTATASLHAKDAGIVQRLQALNTRMAQQQYEVKRELLRLQGTTACAVVHDVVFIIMCPGAAQYETQEQLVYRKFDRVAQRTEALVSQVEESRQVCPFHWAPFRWFVYCV